MLLPLMSLPSDTHHHPYFRPAPRHPTRHFDSLVCIRHRPAHLQLPRACCVIMHLPVVRLSFPPPTPIEIYGHPKQEATQILSETCKKSALYPQPSSSRPALSKHRITSILRNTYNQASGNRVASTGVTRVGADDEIAEKRYRLRT